MATLQSRLQDLATRLGTEFKTHLTLINGNAADNSALTTTDKTNLVAAINEVLALVLGIDITSLINDAATALDRTWSSDKINDTVTTAVADLIAGSPGALDTLKELADAIGDNADFAGTMTAALAARVRADAAQAFTAPQRLQARQNIDAYGSVEIGNPDTNLVATFEAALV